MFTGQPILFYIGAFSSIALVFALGFIDKKNGINKTLSVIGNNSLEIMALHYRKKPYVIEAMQLNFHNRDKIIEFGEGNITLTWRDGYLEGAYVNTLEGVIYATYGDYIIKGVDGEFYPCKPSVFEKTYELVEDIF